MSQNDQVNVRMAAAGRLSLHAATPQAAKRRRAMGLAVKLVLFMLVMKWVGFKAITKGREGFRRLFDVSPGLLAIGFGLELSALVAYSLLTRAAIATKAPSVPTLVRIQMSTKAIGNIVPGGSAAGPALGYRLLTLAGVDSSEAGFALATVGLGSALVLNMMLWIAMLITIPVIGYRPVYVVVAMIGLVVMGLFAGVIVALMRGHQQAERWVRRAAGKVRWLNENRMGDLVQRLSRRLRELLSDRELLRRMVVWATLNWLLDASALWVFLRAFHVTVRPDTLLVAFCIGNVMAAIPFSPGGLGFVEFALVGVLVFAGVNQDAADFGVAAYRLAQFWLPIPLGAICYASLRFGPWKVDRERSLQDLRAETAPVVNSRENVYDWIEKVDPQRANANPDTPR
jgi:putative heme transporter